MDNNEKAANDSKRPYKYIVALDFEATCWLHQPPAEYRNAEIIEFPAVLLNLETGQIEAEFHQYLKPREKPQLSDYCLELTGITQQTVDNGISLKSCLQLFEEWLSKELRSRQLQLPKESKDNPLGNCAFVTWSDYDLSVFLELECRRKSIEKPKYLDQWINMQAIFKKKFHRRKSNNFSNALNYVGLKFRGQQHAGIDDARNLAYLTYKMVKKGTTLKITTDMSPTVWNLNCF
ncbi:ERI1 exoribonuclease 2-like [Lucilia sericata]|uniref:ERI1 exoribonuclease 2-like n=1 Tax=Lucilia sericata TaxID=13632 RepID=UPI0018A86C7F|nr:ERI1 exoribonuclease 2-like [Lucilia sericata]